MRSWLATLGTLAVLVGTAAPAAADQPFALTWQAPEGCPSQSQVEEEIRSALAHLRGRGPVDVQAQVTLRDVEPGFRLRVKVLHAGQVGERVLSIDDCDDASRAAALLVALSVETQPQPSPRIIEREPPKPPPPPPPNVVLGVGPHVVLGIAPGLSAGVGASLALSHSFWRLSLRGAGFAPSHHTVEGTTVGGSFQLYSGAAFACAGYPTSPILFYGCLGGRYDHLSGQGFGTSTKATVSTDLGSIAAGITLEWSVTRRFRLRSDLEAGYPLGDAKFVIRNVSAPVHEVDSLRGEAALELAVVF